MSRPSKEPTKSDATLLSFKLDELESPKPLDLLLSEGFLNELLAEAHSDYRAQAAGQLVGQLQGVDGGALLRATLNATVVNDCRRCLIPVTDALRLPMVVRYLPQRELVAREQLEDGDPEKGAGGDTADLDEEAFEGHRIDLRNSVREHLLLGLPITELCREDCKGLCPTCGQNLNDATCDCRPDPVDLRWQRLKELKLEN